MPLFVAVTTKMFPPLAKESFKGVEVEVEGRDDHVVLQAHLGLHCFILNQL